jgi:hypothetical protein
MEFYTAKESRSTWLALAVAALLLAMGVKAWLAIGGWVPFNSDEAVVALMARHILQGERPVFFYGQAYMGSLDAFLVAGAFAIFGQQVWVIRLVQSLLYLGVLLTTLVLGKAAFGSWRVGVLGMAMMAIPVVNVTLYTTVSLGGYGEALLIGNLVLLIGVYLGRSIKESRTPGAYWLWGLLGFLAGLGLWAFGLSLVFTLPVLFYLVVLVLGWFRIPQDSQAEGDERVAQPSPTANTWKDKLVKMGWSGIALLAGGFLGASPWWGFALKNGFDRLLWELSGGAIAGVEQLPWIFQAGQHLMNLLLLGSTVIFGLRAPWSIDWLVLPLIPFVLFFWMTVLIYIFQSLRKRGPYQGAQTLLLGAAATLVVGFVLTPFGADPSGRYFVPLVVPLSLFAGSLILHLDNRIGGWAYILFLLLLAYSLMGTVQSARRFPPGITTQFYAPSQIDHRYDEALIGFLLSEGETRGYSNYWVTYPLAFHSQEKLIFTPRLPYHLDFRYTERDDRYASYDELVAEAGRVAYITTNHPELNWYLRASFAALGVSWQEAQIGDYTIFYALSQPVRPPEIGLGVTTNP